MMRNIFIVFAVFFLAIMFARAEDCNESQIVTKEDVMYSVNKNLPTHLKGATIIVRLTDGRESKVPAEKFMVVPRKQQFVAGQNKTVSKKLTCNLDQKKNIVYVGAKRELNDLDTKVSNNVGKTESKRTLVPSINYMRRKVLNSDLNVGGGVDKNGQLGGSLGLEF